MTAFRYSEITVEDLIKEIKGDTGRKIFFHESVDSTNKIAFELAEKGTAEGAVVLADSQEKGKGRRGRSWISPPGVNIYLSIITRPSIDPEDVTLLTITASFACTIALRRVTDLKIAIKWPNDLMVCDKKLGGILTEMKTCPGRIIFAIVGIGINVNVDVDAFPDDVKKTATSIRNETGTVYSRVEMIGEILNEFDKWYNALKEGRKKTILYEWQRFTSTLGREIKVVTGTETLTGFAESLDDKGMLILRSASGERKRISAGDVTILR